MDLVHSHLILSCWQHYSARVPSPYSSWYSLSSSSSRLRPHTSQSTTAVSPFFLSRESLGDSVLPAATPYQPTTSDFPSSFSSCYFSPCFFSPLHMSTGYAWDFIYFFPSRSGHRLWCAA